ncbi:MAG: patatin-like phospholipase family protein [Kiritimatiellae bacterium]|nr:patatin-like phospholipase family protein [Kiritimatiellia bacterium]
MTKKGGQRGIALALGGGGARAMSDLGVLQVLDEEQIPVVAIAGTSMGAVIGALYARFRSAEEVTRALKSIDWTPLRYLLDFRFPTRGLTTGDKFRRLFELLLGGAGFSDLAIPFVAVATDLGTGETVRIRHGDLPMALQASISIPTLFCPVRYGERFLTDGGLTEPIPAPTARELAKPTGASCVVAVDTTLDPRYSHDLSVQVPSRLDLRGCAHGPAHTHRIAHRVNQWLSAQGHQLRASTEAHTHHRRFWRSLSARRSKHLSIFDVAIQTSLIRRHTIAEAVLRQADAVIRCHADNIGVLDFGHAMQAAAVGRAAATALLPEIREKMAKGSRHRRRLPGWFR